MSVEHQYDVPEVGGSNPTLVNLFIHLYSKQHKLNRFSLVPCVIQYVCPLMQGQRFDVVLPDLTGLRLKPWGDVGLKNPILALDGSHLELQTGSVGLATVRGQQKVAILNRRESKHNTVPTL